MKIPTVQRTQILGARGAEKVADASVARRTGELWSRFGKIASDSAQKVSAYFAAAKNQEKSNAIYKAETAFNNFAAEFKKGLGKVEGSKYNELYESEYSKFSGSYLKANPDFSEDVDRVLERRFVNNKDTLNSMAIKKHSSDLKVNAQRITAGANELVKRTPELFAESMLNAKNQVERQVESGAVQASEAPLQLARVGKGLTESTISGYARAGRWDEAIAFINNKEVGAILGTEDQDKKRNKILAEQALADGKVRNQLIWERKEQTRKELAIATEQTEGFIHAISKAKTAGAVEQLNRQITANVSKLGLTNLTELTRLTGVALEEASDDSAFSVYGNLTGAETQADFDAVRNDIFKRQAAGTLKADRASLLLTQVKAAQATGKSDPSARFNDKAGLQQIAQQFNISSIEKALDFEGEIAKQWAGALGEFYTLKGQGVGGLEAARRVLTTIRNSRGGSAPIQSITGKKLDSEDAITQAAMHILKKQKNNLINEEQARKQYQELQDAKNFLDLDEMIKNTSPVPFRLPEPAPKKSGNAKSLVEEKEKNTTEPQRRSFGGVTSGY